MPISVWNSNDQRAVASAPIICSGKVSGIPPHLEEGIIRLSSSYKYISSSVWITAILGQDLRHLSDFLSGKMVNFQDPAVEATDSCAYGFTGVYGNCGGY